MPVPSLVFLCLCVALSCDSGYANTCKPPYPAQFPKGHIKGQMMTPPPIAVFDLDGTLVDTAHDLLDAINRTISGEGLAPLARKDLNHLVGQGGRAMLARAFEESGRAINEEGLDRLIPIFIAHYGANMPGQSKPYDGVIELIDALKARGYICAVCTNKTEALARQLLASLNLSHLFAAVCGGDTFDFKKPDPRHIASTIEAAGGDPGRAVMFGDSYADIDAANANKTPVVAVDFGYTEKHVSQFNPTRVISSYRDITVDDVEGLVAAV